MKASDSLLLAVSLVLAVILACTVPKSTPKKVEALPSGVKVRRYPSGLDVEHATIRIDHENFEFAKAKPLNEWFELEHTASCKQAANSPHAIVMTLTHETPSKTGWHFPLGSSITIKLRSGDVLIDKAEQLDLRKDLPSDSTFYESFISDISPVALAKMSTETGNFIYELPAARLTLTAPQSDMLRAFAIAALHCGREE